METEKITESSSKNKTWTKVIIALLAIAFIGQLSAISIAAMTGQSPKPASMLGSMMWPSLLFMSIWSLNGNKKIKGFLLGLGIGFILHFSIGVAVGYLKAEERAIDKAISASNEGLPVMIDEDTRLDSVSIDQKTKNYSLNMSLVNLAQSEIDVAFLQEAFETSIKPSICSDTTFKVFFDEGYKITYSYKDKAGLLVAKDTVNPKDCE